MSRIRSRGNRDTELALARQLRVHGIKRWRRHVGIRGRAVLPRGPNFKAAQQRRPTRTFSVRPDFVFPKLRLALFVDGRFWHGCPKHATKPRNNRTFWQRKLAGNKRRDALVTRTLRRAGWRVVRIWECDLAKRPEVCVRGIPSRADAGEPQPREPSRASLRAVRQDGRRHEAVVGFSDEATGLNLRLREPAAIWSN